MSSAAGLRRGDLMPHFDATALDGEPFRYASVWQRRHLVLFVVPASGEDPAAGDYLARLREGLSRLQPADTVLAAVPGPVPGLPRSAVVVSDRWGEIVWLQDLPPQPEGWPPVDDVLEWVGMIRARC